MALESNSSQSFPKSSRLLKQSEFQALKTGSQKYSTASFTVLKKVTGQTNPRLGLVAAKKQMKRAYDRNRFKRLIRESFRKQSFLLKQDYVFIIKSAALKLSNQEFEQQVQRFWFSCSKAP